MKSSIITLRLISFLNPLRIFVFKDQCTNPGLYCELVNDYPNLLTFNAPASNAATDVRHVVKTHGGAVRNSVCRLSKS